MLEIDGSYGEGGGQILRTALSLSCHLGMPFRIYNIRKGRKKPGLMPQHLTAVRASALVSGAKVRGDSVGSTELIFEPNAVRAGEYFFDIGTAGSTTLLAQSLIPPLLFQEGHSVLILKGGTHVPMSPPFHYFTMAFIPMLKRLGLKIEADIESYGFYPKGGGKIRLTINGNRPSVHDSVFFTERGKILSVEGISAVCNLPLSIAQRQKDALIKALTPSFSIEESAVRILEANGPGQGTFIFLAVETECSHSGFSALGQRGKSAEAVGKEAASEFISYFSTGMCLDPHMADQIVHYLSLLFRHIEFTTSKITGHLLSNLWVTEQFLGIRYSVRGEEGSPGLIEIQSPNEK